MSENNFSRLSKINVNDKIEKKGNLSYLSWAHAVSILLNEDATASWDYRWFGDVPFCTIGDTAMVFCSVTAFGVTRTAQLPVMDHRNKPVSNPDSFQLNNTMQRALVKAIALHGIGLYIYAGEDLPADEEEPRRERIDTETGEVIQEAKQVTMEDVKAIVKGSGITGAMLKDRYGAIENVDLDELKSIVSRIKSGEGTADELMLERKETYAQIAGRIRASTMPENIDVIVRYAQHLPKEQLKEIKELALQRIADLTEAEAA